MAQGVSVTEAAGLWKWVRGLKRINGKRRVGGIEMGSKKKY